MSNKLYVGNLNYQTTEAQIQAAFSPFGQVSSINIIMDRESGRPRGFAFVEMSTAEEAQAAIDGLNDKEFDGRNLTVNVARERSGGGGGHRGGGGGGYGGGGGGRDRY